MVLICWYFLLVEIERINEAWHSFPRNIYQTLSSKVAFVKCCKLNFRKFFFNCEMDCGCFSSDKLISIGNIRLTITDINHHHQHQCFSKELSCQSTDCELNISQFVRRGILGILSPPHNHHLRLQKRTCKYENFLPHLTLFWEYLCQNAMLPFPLLTFWDHSGLSTLLPFAALVFWELVPKSICEEEHSLNFILRGAHGTRLSWGNE